MRNILKLHIIIYLVVIGLYIYKPTLGSAGQFILGLVQLVTAIKMSLEIDSFENNSNKHIKYYWLTILIWVCLLVSLIITSQIEKFSIIILFVIPMIIGFFFLLVAYFIKKTYKS